MTVGKGAEHLFSARDLNFTLKRIQSLGSLSPDYILVSQAVDNFAFEGPDAENIIRFKFRGDRIWSEADIKEVLSFKILPDNAPMNALNYRVGTAACRPAPEKGSRTTTDPGSPADQASCCTIHVTTRQGSERNDQRPLDARSGLSLF
jgi:hypothetical protein